MSATKSNHVTIVERNGWLYAKIDQPYGTGRAVMHALRTKSMAEAKQKVESSNLEYIAQASHADALTRDVWTRLMAGRKIRTTDAAQAWREHRHIRGCSEKTVEQWALMVEVFMRLSGTALNSIAAVETKHVSAFVNRPGPQAYSTRSLWLKVITLWLEYCVKQQWIVRTPAVDVRVRLEGLTQKQLTVIPHPAFSEEQVTKLLAAIPRTDFWHGAILFAYHFGLRIGTVAMLEESNFADGELRVFTTKGRRLVRETLTPDVIAWLAEWKTVRPVSDMTYLFPEQAASHLAGAGLSRQFRKLMARHGITDRTFHGLRKTATNREWTGVLAELGDRQAQALAKLVMEKGYRRVQQMLAHEPGSDVTEKHYMATAP